MQSPRISGYRLRVPKREAGKTETSVGLPRLPPGRHGLTRDFVVKNQRDRLTAGIIAAVAEHGYHDATVSKICAAAGLSRRTFYSYFSSKEECYQQAFDLIVDHLVAAMREAGGEQDGWPAQVGDRIRAMLETFAANPDLVRFAVIAPLRAGDEMTARQAAGVERLLEELTKGKQAAGVRPVSAAIEQAQVGGMMAVIAHRVETGRQEQLLDLLPDLVELFLMPFLGGAQAGTAPLAEG